MKLPAAALAALLALPALACPPPVGDPGGSLLKKAPPPDGNRVGEESGEAGDREALKDREEPRRRRKPAGVAADRIPRELPEYVPKEVPVRVADGRVAPVKGGFMVLEGSEFVRYDAAGGSREVVFKASGEVKGWWGEGLGQWTAWSAGGALWLRGADGAERELGDEPTGAVVFSADRAWVVWTAASAVWVAETGKDAKPVQIRAPKGFAPAGPAALCVSQKKAFALLRPEGGSAATVVGVALFAGSDAEFREMYRSTEGALTAIAATERTGAVVVAQAIGEGAKTKTAIRRVEADGSAVETLMWTGDVADLRLADDNVAWIAAPGANGRRQVWCTNVFGVGTMKELDQRSIASSPDGDCLFAAREPGADAYYVVVKDAAGSLKLFRWSAE
jgi:hypothetical protein